MIIEKIEDRDGIISFRDKETGGKYGRIVGGFGWPAAKPGFVVVVAEDLIEEPFLKIRITSVLVEIEDQSLERLFQKCLDLRERYQVEDFYGNTENRPMMEFLYDYNRDHKDMAPLWLRLASFPEDFSYHVHVIEGGLNQDKKTLYLGEKSMLRGHLMELSPEEIMRASVWDHPSIAALGYAVSQLKRYAPRKKSRPRRRPTSWKTI